MTECNTTLCFVRMQSKTRTHTLSEQDTHEHTLNDRVQTRTHTLNERDCLCVSCFVWMQSKTHTHTRSLWARHAHTHSEWQTECNMTLCWVVSQSVCSRVCVCVSCSEFTRRCAAVGGAMLFDCPPRYRERERKRVCVRERVCVSFFPSKDKPLCCRLLFISTQSSISACSKSFLTQCVCICLVHTCYMTLRYMWHGASIT